MPLTTNGCTTSAPPAGMAGTVIVSDLRLARGRTHAGRSRTGSGGVAMIFTGSEIDNGGGDDPASVVVMVVVVGGRGKSRSSSVPRRFDEDTKMERMLSKSDGSAGRIGIGRGNGLFRPSSESSCEGDSRGVCNREGPPPENESARRCRECGSAAADAPLLPFSGLSGNGEGVSEREGGAEWAPSRDKGKGKRFGPYRGVLWGLLVE
mmetsp:Transcript_41462/g.67278  ORF Transcript_41462/g.67278 Transcript_41462/m.67278 type:complete len:207 (-) Transcript_41462:1944-2564(-)